MTQRLHTGRLVLTPQDPYFVPKNPTDLFDALRDIGLIASPLEAEQGYLLGEAFMQLITFMGCSPFIRLEPDESGEPFCHLRVDGPHSEPILLTGKNSLPPRCEACRKRISDWPIEPRQLAECPHCGHHQDPASYDFKQSAGFGRFLLKIENIFPQEAIPSPRLLEVLQQASNGAPWHHFYQQD
ncbi:MAG: hypothetical protein MI756_06785 [Chromatiales bacterium]|nr:hypothetical protein [Chromatiales bacterium]